MVGHTIFGACEAAPVAWGGRTRGLGCWMGEGAGRRGERGNVLLAVIEAIFCTLFYFILFYLFYVLFFFDSSCWD